MRNIEEQKQLLFLDFIMILAVAFYNVYCSENSTFSVLLQLKKKSIIQFSPFTMSLGHVKGLPFSLE